MKFLTQLNSGCIDICKNMLKSAENVGLNMNDFIIACLDKNAYENLKQYQGAFLYNNIELTEYQNWSFDPNSNFRKIVKSKWKLISEIYKQHKNLCWVDTDIIFKSNPLSWIENKKEILFQCDIPGSLICSGFMVFNNSGDCENLINECGKNEIEDDQILINTIARNYKNCALLPMEYFPNGHLYYSKNIKENAIIVHNNHMVGIETKINKFKETNENKIYLGGLLGKCSKSPKKPRVFI